LEYAGKLVEAEEGDLMEKDYEMKVFLFLKNYCDNRLNIMSFRRYHRRAMKKTIATCFSFQSILAKNRHTGNVYLFFLYITVVFKYISLALMRRVLRVKLD